MLSGYPNMQGTTLVPSGKNTTITDIEHIARKQTEDYEKYARNGKGIVIFDTWLIITKVWFDMVFGKYPRWLDEKISRTSR